MTTTRGTHSGKNPLDALASLAAKKRPSKTTLAPVKATQLSLELWPDAVRGVPNAVLRGSLFTVSKQRATAKKRELLAAVEGIEIRFKGERFNQTDLDLWEMLLHLARMQPLGNQVEFTAYSLLKELGRGTGGKDHDDLKEDISRLLGGVVEITWTDTNKTFLGHLVEKAYRDETTQRYVVVFDQKMLGLYEGGYSYVDWQRRKALKGNSLAKWLQGFYASHAAPYPYKVETIKNLCGSTVARLTDFRRLLKAGLDELVQVGSIESWSIKDDLIHIENIPTKSQARHLIKKLR
jgi:hypothetical protein